MEEITTNTKTLELTGDEIRVHFTSAFPYFWVRNDGSGTVLMSLSPNIEEGNDGVIEVLAGSSAGTMHGFNDTRSDLYLLGSGKVQVMGTYTPENPFRKARKGGEENAGSNILPYSAGLTAYFDYQKNVSENGWIDIVKGLKINANMAIKDNAVNILSDGGGLVDIDINQAFTIYAVFKTTGDQNVIAKYNETGFLDLVTRSSKIGLYSTSNSARYVSPVSSLDYHVCALTFVTNYDELHIDGNSIVNYRGVPFAANTKYALGKSCDFKMAAFFNNVVQSHEAIAANSQYLAQKYGIEI